MLLDCDFLLPSLIKVEYFCIQVYMYSKIKQNKVLFFLLKALMLYVLWYMLYELWIGPEGYLDAWVINNLVDLSSFILKVFGYRLMPEPLLAENIRTVGIDGTHGLWIGDPCNGISLFALFIGFVLAYPGSAQKKVWFIPLGILTIHLLNVIRIVLLTIIVKKAPEYLAFNHTYTFTFIVYSYVFILWMIWANKLSIPRESGK